MNKRFLLSTGLSFFLHSLAVLLLVITNSEPLGDKTSRPKKGGEGSLYEGVNVDSIIPKQKPTEIEIHEILLVDKSEIVVPQPKKKKVVDVDKQCPDKWYGGIGIRNTYDPILSFERIIEVFPGYAADMVGLKPGDLILWTSDSQIVGQPGTVLTIKILRKSRILYFTLIRVKVCY